MSREFTEAEAARHNSLTERGWQLAREHFHVAGSSAPALGWFSRRNLQRAVGCFQEALELNPDGWSSMWALGKIYQRLGEHRTSLEWLRKAHAVNPGQPDVAREAGLAALDCAEPADAVELCSAAVANNPDDPGLVANLALAFMLNGDDDR